MKRVCKMTARTVFAAFLIIVSSCARSPTGAADEAGLRALDAAYVDAWLTTEPSDQEKAVLALFDRAAVIMPGGGLSPEVGIANLKNFWFPDGAPPTIVNHFTHDIAHTDISGNLGVISGRYALSFTYENQSIAQAGNYLIVAEHGVAGWRIRRMIWNDQPLTDV